MAADLRKVRTSWDAASWAAEAAEDMDSWRSESRRLLGELGGRSVAVRRRIGVETLSMLTPEDLESFRSRLISDAYAKGTVSAKAKTEAFVADVVARVSDRWGAFASTFRAPERPRSGDPVEAAIDWSLIIAKGLKEMVKDTGMLAFRAALGLALASRWLFGGLGILLLPGFRSGGAGDAEFVSDALAMAGAVVGVAAAWVVGEAARSGSKGRTHELAMTAVWLAVGVWTASEGRFAHPLAVVGAVLVAAAAAAGTACVAAYAMRRRAGKEDR